ncbi:MAG: cache domain-containing protein, partial [Pseudomonadota bacterium]
MSKRTIILSLCAALLAVGLCLFVGMQVAVDRANSQMQDRLLLARQTVLSYLATYEQLPSVLALDSRVISLLDPLATPEEANRVSEYLEDVRARTAASEIFLMNGNGLTLAASNHDSVLSFVGRNYQFRPYFMDALQTGSGGMFAIGATTGVPGYFMAQRIRTTGYREGVIVVKVDLQRIVERWQSASEDYFISDSDSIVFLATEQSDIYRPIQPLEHSALFRLQASRSYEQVSSNFQRPLVTQVLPENTNWFWSNDGRVVGMLPLGVNGWNIHTSTSLLQLVMFVSAIAALLSFSLALLAAGAVIFRQQRKYAQLQLEQTRELEQKVDERTHLLRNEIEDRKRAEKR